MRSGVHLKRSLGQGAALAAMARERAHVLTQIAHPGVLVPESVDVVHDDVSVTMPVVAGIDLSVLERLRSPLTAAECIWLGIHIADALAAMHRAGLAHGDISPANVMVDGRTVTVVDTMGGCRSDEHGTAGFASPERPQGATVASDAYAVGALLRWAVASVDRPLIEAWTAPLMSAEPHRRPSLAVTATALRCCIEPMAVTVPHAEVDVLVRPGRGVRTQRLASGRSWRWRRRAVRAAVAVGGMAAAIAIVMVGGPAVDSWAAQRGAVTVSTPPPVYATPIVRESADVPSGALSTYHDPEAAAAELTRLRFAALAANDGKSLRTLVSGDAATAADVRTLAVRLETNVIRYAGLEAEVLGAELVDHTATRAAVKVTADISAHTIHGEASRTVEPYREQAILDLRWTDGRWAVLHARPAS